MGKKRNLKMWLVMSVLLVGMAPVIVAGGTIYVDADASPGGDGTSWATAYKYLQDALYKPPTGGDEIWVVAGIYKPDQGGGKTPGDRTATFQVTNGVALYGGFAGGETSLDERDWQTNETILSGDIGTQGVNGDNSYHVATGSGTNNTAVLDGFTITAGNAEIAGGGMFNNSGSPTVSNCTFSGNSAGFGGGGMYNDSGSPTVTNCTFTGNSANAKGGGMYNEYGSPTVTNCTFSGNSAVNYGGGMYNSYSSPTVTNCRFSGNSANDGGGIGNRGNSPTVTNCTFSGNSGGNSGGGMYNWVSGNPTLTNCTFSGNSANNGGGIHNYSNSSPTVTNCIFSGNSAVYDGGGMRNSYNSSPTVTNCTFSVNSANRGGGMVNYQSSPTVINCILWGDSAPTGPEIHNSASTPTVTYSDIAGGYGGTGNIPDDPLFIGPNGLDGIPGTADDNLRLSVGSPCIDAGDNTAVPADTTDLDGDGNTTEPIPFDLDGNLRFVDDPATTDTGNPPEADAIVDMGAYEYGILNLAPVADVGMGQTAHIGTLVNLNGSGSYDSDENYPLSYSWQITSKPSGSEAELFDSDLPNPSFYPDVEGDYIIELVVTDSLGLDSQPSSVVISTYNTPPVAAAGADQAVVVIGSLVQLDGSQSYDIDGDDITYLWTMTQKPDGSTAVLSDPCVVEPNFIADVQGDYVISLTVTDIFDVVSQPDTVTVSFENVKPVADAGGNQSVIAGDTVFLDGSGSYDGNGDLLSYSWSFVSKPSESLAELSDANVVNPSFIADEPGEYVVSLVVNDSFVDSDPANVTIIAITTQEAVAITLVETVETVNLLDPESLKNKNLSNALTNKINAALAMIDDGLYEDALDKLVHDILQKTNGCADTGQPDKNDWITTCEEQGQVYPLIIEAIELLENLI